VERAKELLKRNPNNQQARTDYNFAVSRIMEAVNDGGLKPAKTPMSCPGASGAWLLSIQASQHPELDLRDFRIIPSDRYDFKGTMANDRKTKAGLGAPMIVTGKGIDFTKKDPFAQSKTPYYGMTVVVEIKGRQCVASLIDPLSTETVKFEGHVQPLAADFSAPISMALAELKPRKAELKRMFKPEDSKDSARLARLQPYDPKKIPLLVIHGLGDSQATWAPMIESLRADPMFRANYQIWFYSYPTGYPYALMAAVLRQKLDEVKARYPDHKPIVVLGHSMGGMIARSLMTDSGMTLWNTFFTTPPEQTQLSEGTRQIMTSALIFKHRPDVSRVILASASLRGSYMATNFMGRLGAKIIGSPADLALARDEVAALRKPDADGGKKKRVPNSISGLNPDNPFLHTINSIPPAKGIPYHSIIGDRGKGGNKDHTPPESTDGIVPYWSSHIDGARSEIIIPSDHWTIRVPQAAVEVLRILREHIRK
jgi:pimeloyl-ACP methyl ester carboxylesterase